MTIVSGQEDIMVTTTQGVMIRFNVDSVSQTGRATLGVRLIRLEGNAKVATLAKVEHEEVLEDVSRETSDKAPLDEQQIDQVSELLDRAQEDTDK